MIPSALTAQLEQGVADFLRYSFWSSTPGMEHVIDDLLGQPGGVTKGPYLSLRLPFVKGENPNFFEEIPLGFIPHAHQEQAFERLGGRRKRSTLIATGTGSGKTECFLLPILSHCLAHASTPGIKAILIYPMNALATDQAERIAQLVHGNDALRGRITAGLYIGESRTKQRAAAEKMGPRQVITDRETMQAQPPDILLTNYKMLDLLLLRPWAQSIWQHNAPGVLRYLVVDELHTFDGAQGTDLACLIRRLKRRLQADDGSLCCVGTSATLGSGDEREKLLGYAEQVFGEPFDERALIGESRLSAADFLGDAPVEHTDEPSAAELAELHPEHFEDPGAWLLAQVRLWFGAIHRVGQDEDWAVALGDRLLRHATFRTLLGLLDGQVVALDEVVQALARSRGAWRQDPELGRAAVTSLLGLAAAARRRDPGDPTGRASARLVDLRLQLWQREMRRMVATVERRPLLRYSDDLDREQKRAHLPLVHCRDCGAMGWGTYIDPDKEHKLGCDLSAFYRAFFSADPRVLFLYPEAARPAADPLWTSRPAVVADSKTLVKLGPDEQAEGERVELVACSNRRATERGPRLHRDCPFCGARGSLTLVGFRAATLTSTYIDQIFASRYNDEKDKKLLAFSDSVQDAAHRAGFYGARTWRTNLRVGLHRVIERGGEGATLAETARRFVDHWRGELDDVTWVSTFIAPNMLWLHEWDDIQREGRIPEGSDIADLIAERLRYEIAGEFGTQATIGRSLPRTGAAAVYLDAERIDGACAALLEPLRNEVPGMRQVSGPQLHRFLLGLLHHLRMRGGIHHAAMPQRYLESGGRDTYIFKQRVCLPALGKSSRLPAFLTDSPGRGPFDSWHAASGAASSWYARWMHCCFGLDEALGADARSLYPVLLGPLVAAGLLVEREAGGRFRVWGVADSALRVTGDVVQLRCPRCDHRLPAARAELADWLETPCLTGRCDGRYQAVDGQRVDYFGRLYRHGDLQRIYTAEHTGLLTREERETIEQRFKAESDETAAGGRRPWYPNLLSCTPTLELGIDIGDLSTVILCSVPPTQASYLQRIGRAGRRSGNAAIMTLAGARPHDLYFYAQPEEMMAGDVLPPGVFLDASAVLERQLTAFCFDRWVSREGERAALPVYLRDVFAHLDDAGRDRFPHNLLAFIEQHQPTILREFFEMFADEISAPTREHLREFLLGEAGKQANLRWRLLDVFEREKKQLDSLRHKAQQVNKAIKKLSGNEARPLDYEQRLTALEDEKAALLALVARLGGGSQGGRGRQTLEFLTDEGMLPNYAFPESAIRLSSVIWRKKKRVPERGSKYETWTYEYARSPSSALSEMAPGADFYAGGRRVRIDQVDVAVSEIETWRFCDACNHAQRDDVGERAPACPACGSTSWVDDEQKLRLLPLRQVFANAPDRESRIRDDRDERQPRFFNRQVLIDHHDVDRQGAWSIADAELPFGFELLRRATFREVNFGERSDQGPKRKVAGREEVRVGFQVCTRCGKVQDPNGEPRHAFSCPTRTRGEAERIEECLYLYREFGSEALRMLLPMADVSTRRQLNSFVAALQLGLQSRFGGSVDHLRTMVYSEPEKDSSLRRQYLVLYDSVPGGTGYVKQLVTPVRAGGDMPLAEALQAARALLRGCSCWDDPDRDGCYRCLLAYRNARDMDDTKASVAVELLDRLLEKWQALEPIESLGEVSVAGMMDSVLEARFIESLRQASHKGAPCRVKYSIFHEKPGYHLTVGEQEWAIEPQLELGKGHGLGLEVSVDFMLWPASRALRDENRKPIAVFLDGFEFHKDRIGRDLLQRQCLLASGRYDVWSLTWYDLDQALGIATRQPANVLHPDLMELRAGVKKTGLMAGADTAERGSFELLLDELARTEPFAWEHFAGAAMASRMALAVAGSGPQDWDALIQASAPAAVRPLLAAGSAGRVLIDQGQLNPFVSLAACHDGEALCIVAEIDDAPERWEEKGFIEAWNGYLRLFQLLRGAPNAWFLARSWRDEPGWSELVLLRSGPEAAAGWADGIETEPAFAELCQQVEQAGLGAPEIGVDLPAQDEAVWCMAELAWQDEKVAVVEREAVADAAGQVAAPWRVFTIEELETAAPVIAALQQQGGA